MTSVSVLASVHALLVAGALMLSAPAACAETTPRPGPHDNRVRIATWTEGQVYRIVTTLTVGRVNFDLHAHAGSDAVTYEKARGQTSGMGSFETSFAGDHGWFWRNRDKADVTVTLQLRGDYSEIVRSE